MSRSRCEVFNCGETRHSHGLCDRHAKQWTRAHRQHPDRDPAELRPGADYDAWAIEWLTRGEGKSLAGQLCPWPHKTAKRGGQVEVVGITDSGEVRRAWLHYRERVLGKAPHCWAVSMSFEHEAQLICEARKIKDRPTRLREVEAEMRKIARRHSGQKPSKWGADLGQFCELDEAKHGLLILADLERREAT